MAKKRIPILKTDLEAIKIYSRIYKCIGIQNGCLLLKRNDNLIRSPMPIPVWDKNEVILSSKKEIEFNQFVKYCK